MNLNPQSKLGKTTSLGYELVELVQEVDHDTARRRKRQKSVGTKKEKACELEVERGKREGISEKGSGCPVVPERFLSASTTTWSKEGGTSCFVSGQSWTTALMAAPMS